MTHSFSISFFLLLGIPIEVFKLVKYHDIYNMSVKSLLLIFIMIFMNYWNIMKFSDYYWRRTEDEDYNLVPRGEPNTPRISIINYLIGSNNMKSFTFMDQIIWNHSHPIRRQYTWPIGHVIHTRWRLHLSDVYKNETVPDT